MKAIINGELFLGNEFVLGKAIVVDGNKIVDILPQEELDNKYSNIEKIDAEKAYVAPGFVDLQINGCGGVLFNDEISLDAIETMYKTNLKYGCTSFTPTLITTSSENIKKAISLAKSIEDKKNYGFLGLHIEGPYISIPKKGIHNPKFIRKADKDVIEEMVKAGKENVRIVTLAPENNDKEVISDLATSGINVAVGHSNATYEEVKEKECYGITLSTHLYNGMSSFNHREPGVVGAVFDSDIKAGIIVDGFHCHFSAIKSAKKIMGERLYLVTDAVSPVGTNMEYFYFEGNKVYYKDGKCFGEDGTLGGSALTMIDGVKNLVRHCGLRLEEALRMASLYPAKAIKIDDKFGKIQPGYFADLVFIDKHLNLKKVMANGNIVK